MPSTLKHFLKDESGATALEYGLLISIMVIGIIGSIESFGTSVLSYLDGAVAGFALR